MSTPAFFRGFLAHGRGLFTKVVRASPEDGLEYQADPRARTARELIQHLIGHNLDLQELLEDGRQQLAWLMLLDAVRHRGQLSTYLRPMGSKVPAIYGPSADHRGDAHRLKCRPSSRA